jgi:hypothetical protein
MIMRWTRLRSWRRLSSPSFRAFVSHALTDRSDSFSSGTVWSSCRTSLIRARYTGSRFRLNRAFHHPLAYRPQTDCEPRMGANLAMNPAAALTNRRHPNARHLMARPLLPEQIKAIRVTSRGVSPYFGARKHTPQPGGHAGSRLSNSYLQGQLHGAKVPDVAEPCVGTFPGPGGCRSLR